MLEGGCACGAIRYRVNGTALGFAACHCRRCQYATGGGPNYVARVAREDFVLLRGAPTLHASIADSGNEVTRAFCGACGSPLWSDVPNRAFVPIRVGSFDDPAAMRPQAHYWCEEAPPWHTFEDDAPRFDKGAR